MVSFTENSGFKRVRMPEIKSSVMKGPNGEAMAVKISKELGQQMRSLDFLENHVLTITERLALDNPNLSALQVKAAVNYYDKLVQGTGEYAGFNRGSASA